MHRHEYAIQMGLPMNDDSMFEQDAFMFHVAPDAGPDVTLGLLKTLYDNSNTYFANMRQLCKASMASYGVGSHHFDAGKMARLVKLITAPSLQVQRPVRLTELGLRIVTAASRLQVELIHYLLYTGWDARQPTRTGPLCTYRQVCDILWNGAGDKISSTKLLRGLRFALDNIYGEVPDYQPLHLSLSGKSLRGVTVWLERLCPPTFRNGCFTHRRDCPNELLVLALGWLVGDQIAAHWQHGKLDLTLGVAERELLCRLCLLDPAALDPLLDRACDYHREYITDGGRTTGGQRIINLHRRPNLSDDALIGRGTRVDSD